MLLNKLLIIEFMEIRQQNYFVKSLQVLGLSGNKCCFLEMHGTMVRS